MANLVRVGGGSRPKVPKSLVPIMTSNTSPSGYVASASSTYNSNLQPYLAFDGVDSGGNDHWLSAKGKVVNEWLQIELPKAEVCRCLEYYIGTNDNISAMKTFKLQGSNDGQLFDDLGTFTNDTTTLKEKRIYAVANERAYKYYRITVLSGYYSEYVSIGEIILSDLDTRDYLYKDGKQSVVWDNGIYNPNTTYYSVIKPLDLNEGSLSGQLTTNGDAYSFITSNVVDLSAYSKVKMQYNSTQTMELDISNINASDYVGLLFTRTGNTTYFGIDITPEKTNYNSKQITEKVITSLGTTKVYINRIWLEK